LALVTTISRTPLAEQAANWLREQITSGHWPLGSRIPAEPELVALTKLGRNTVREAVKSLTYAGLLEIRHGEGTFVRSSSELVSVIDRRVHTAELREVYEARRGLETELARLAADRRSEADLRMLRESFDRRATALAAAMSAEANDAHEVHEVHDAHEVERRLAAFVTADAAFHHAVAVAAHSAVLGEIYDGLSGRLICGVAEMMRRRPYEASEPAHAELLDAIERGDQDRARARWDEFLSESLAALLHDASGSGDT
jgi:DNA-binding FadR family transcriptional regulator